MSILNGKIVATMLGIENGKFTFFLDIEFDSGHRVYGNYVLAEYDKNKKCIVGTVTGLNVIIKLLATLEMSSWEKLKDTFIRCEIDDYNQNIVHIGHLIKNRWFSVIEFSEKEKDNYNDLIKENKRLTDDYNNLIEENIKLMNVNKSLNNDIKYMIANNLGAAGSQIDIKNIVEIIDKNTGLCYLK